MILYYRHFLLESFNLVTNFVNFRSKDTMLLFVMLGYIITYVHVHIEINSTSKRGFSSKQISSNEIRNFHFLGGVKFPRNWRADVISKRIT